MRVIFSKYIELTPLWQLLDGNFKGVEVELWIDGLMCSLEIQYFEGFRAFLPVRACFNRLIKVPTTCQWPWIRGLQFVLLSAVVLCAPGNTNYVFLNTPTFRFLDWLPPSASMAKLSMTWQAPRWASSGKAGSRIPYLARQRSPSLTLKNGQVPALFHQFFFVFRNNFSERMEQKPPVGQKRLSFANALVCCVFFLECFEFRTSWNAWNRQAIGWVDFLKTRMLKVWVLWSCKHLSSGFRSRGFPKPKILWEWLASTKIWKNAESTNWSVKKNRKHDGINMDKLPTSTG